MKRLTRYLPLLLLAASAIGLFAYALSPVPVSVEVGRVTQGPLVVTVDEDGKTRVKERYLVSAPLSGLLGRIEFHPGDLVAANQTVLATIEPTNPELLDARLLAEAESRVKAAEAAKSQALARLEAAREDQGLAEHELARAKGLIRSQAISAAEFDTAEHRERMAAAFNRAAEFANRVATFELELAQAAFVRTRPDTQDQPLQRLEIRSPVDGQVLRVIQESAVVVTSGQPLLEIGNTSELEIVIDVLSTDATKIQPGARVYLEQWGGAGSLSGRVRLVEPAGFTKISALGVEEQRVNVIADFDEPKEKWQGLGDGYRVDARIVIWETEQAIKIATGALFRHGQEWAVFIIQNDYARLRPVTVGHMNVQEAEILEGLAAGDEVIDFPSDKVRDGVRVSKRFQ